MMVSTPAELMIIVMGVTGTGKSSFLKLLTGNDAIRISHSECCTAEVEAYKAPVVLDGKTHMITFVDTPGFDDDREGHDDASILRGVGLWLARAYQEKTQVAGVIYLRRITDERQTTSLRRSLKVLRHITGEDQVALVHMVTNRWELVKASEDQAKASEREHKLLGKGGCWNNWFGEYGAGYSRHDNTYGSAVAIIQRILQNPPAYVQIQTEIVDKEMALGDTPAGKAVICGLEQKLQEDREEIAALEEDIKDVPELEKDPNQEELRKLHKRGEFLEAQKQNLKTESHESSMKSIMKVGAAVVCGVIFGAAVF